ncbi:MAG: DUF488 domain-containing protein [Motilibacteraceae bacterium]
MRAVPVSEVRGGDGSGRRGRTYLVDRLWPRGVRKEDLALDGWPREVAPSTELRRWFGHDPDRWEEFRRRYGAELDANPQTWEPLLEDLAHDDVLLVFSARDHLHNNAVALRDYLLGRRGGR